MARKKKQQSSEPKKQGRLAKIRQVYTAAHQVDPVIGWWMLLAFVATLAVVVAVGVLVGHWVYALILGLPLALLAATLVLSRRAERAAYRSIEGQPGAAGAALRSLRKGWYYTEEPVAADANRQGDVSNAAFVFRAVGAPGVVLIGDGPKARVVKLLEAERKKVARVAPGVPIHLVIAGDGDGEDEVPVRKLNRKIRRMKGTLTKQEVSVVHKRLKSLGGMKLPVPAGMDPSKARVDRKSMRGR